MLPWGLLSLTLLASILSIAPPQAGTVPLESGYDPARAFESLEFLARKPHPIGSEAHAAVREFIIGEIVKTGARAELQRGVVAENDLINVIAHLPGEQSTGTVLLMAHYDTVLQTPGAGDDCSGVVALLETLRVLAKVSLRNDVILLFTDGEEEGLLGAKLFAREHPAFESIEVVLNFEAIGNAGPAVMFETGPQSGGLVELWGETVPFPVGNCLATVIYG